MRSWTILFMLGILGISPFLQAQEVAKENAFSLVNVLPERTLLITGAPDVSCAKKAFTQTNLYRLFQDPEVNRFFKPFIQIIEPEIEKGLNEFAKNMGITLEETLSMATGEIFLSIVDVFPGEKMPLGAVLSFEFGSQQRGVMHFLSMAEKKGRIRFTEQKFEGFSLYESQKPPVCYAIIENTFVLASKKELLEELLFAYIGKPKAKLLKDNPGAKKVASILLHSNKKEEKASENPEEKQVHPSTPAFLFYLNIENAFTCFEKMIPPPVLKMIEDLGIKDIRALGLGSNFEGEGLYSTLYIYAPGAKSGIHKLYQGEPLNVQELAKNVPDFSSVFSCGKLNLLHFISTVEEILHLLDPKGEMGYFSTYNEILSIVEQKLGFSIKDDLAAAFLGEVFSLGFYEGGLFAETASAIPVKNKEKAEKCIQNLCSILKMEKKSVELDSRTYYYFINPLGKLGDNPFKTLGKSKEPVAAMINALQYSLSGMSYVYDGDYLYLGQTLQGLSSYMLWKDSKKTSLADKKDFQEIVPAGKHINFLYYNPQHSIHIWWNTIRSLVRYFEGYIRGAGIPIETALLPRAQTLASYFAPGTLSISLEEDGLLFSSKGSLDVMIVGVGALGIGAGIAIPGIIQAKEKAEEASLMAELKSIYTSIQLYNVEYAKYPPSGEGLLKELLAKNFLGSIDIEKYECTEIPLEFYKNNPDFPIVWMKRENKKGERMVLYFSGVIERLYRYKFNWALKDAQKLYEKKFKK